MVFKNGKVIILGEEMGENRGFGFWGRGRGDSQISFPNSGFSEIVEIDSAIAV
jgi:hypothetical protein